MQQLHYSFVVLRQVMCFIFHVLCFTLCVAAGLAHVLANATGIYKEKKMTAP